MNLIPNYRSDTTNDSIRLMASRVGTLPEELARTLEDGIGDINLGVGVEGQRFVVTGVGASATSARFLVYLLREHLAMRASYLPISSFFQRTTNTVADTLIVFSQGLSPNAELALNQVHSYRNTVLFTSIEADEAAPPGSPERRLAVLQGRGVKVWHCRPKREDGFLVRVVGPAVARLTGALFAGKVAQQIHRHDWMPPPRDLSTRVKNALKTSDGPMNIGPLFTRPCILVTCGGYDEICNGLAWSVLETLMVPAPVVLDAFHLVHGAYQQMFDSACDVIALERPGPEKSVFDTLEKMLVPARHRLIRLRSTLGDPYSIFEHDARVTSLILDVLRARPRDLFTWPGMGQDAPLYNLGNPIHH